MSFDKLITTQLGLCSFSADYCLGVRRAFDQLSAGSTEGCDPPAPGESLDVEDAFVEQDGSTFYAVQGNNGRRLRSFKSRAEAEEYVEFLHRKNKPSGSNRGAAAKKKVAAQRRESES